MLFPVLYSERSVTLYSRSSQDPVLNANRGEQIVNANAYPAVWGSVGQTAALWAVVFGRVLVDDRFFRMGLNLMGQLRSGAQAIEAVAEKATFRHLLAALLVALNMAQTVAIPQFDPTTFRNAQLTNAVPVPLTALDPNNVAPYFADARTVQSRWQEAIVPVELSLQQQLQENAAGLLEELEVNNRRLALASRFRTFSIYPVDPVQNSTGEGLVPSLAVFERFRPPSDWLDTVERKSLSPMYGEYRDFWRDGNGVVKRVAGVHTTKIPAHLAPMYEYVEDVFGISRYLLMAVVTIETKQTPGAVSPTNCQGWGQFCPSTSRLFMNKKLLPPDFSPYDEYTGIAGIAVHLWVSSLGTGEYLRIVSETDENGRVNWPTLWAGETPSFAEVERIDRRYPIIQGLWGYNRSSTYGWAVLQLAKFYQEQDQIEAAL